MLEFASIILKITRAAKALLDTLRYSMSAERCAVAAVGHRSANAAAVGRLLTRLLDGKLDFISISSMTAVSAALSRKWAELVYLNMGRAIRKFKLRSCRA